MRGTPTALPIILPWVTSFQENLAQMFTLCILNCDDSKVWSPVDFGDMFKASIHEEDKECDACYIWNIAKEKKLPDYIHTCTAIVISGSRFNCRDNLEWYEPLCELIREVEKSGKQRLYGGCFGCQLIAHALGGSVDYNPNSNFVLKAENVQIVPEVFWQVLPTVAADITSCCCSPDADQCDQIDETIIASKQTLNLIVSHGDCVTHLPPGAELLASSESCKHEIFIAGRHRNILACQSHPEFDLQYSVHERIWPAVVDTSQRLTEQEIMDAQASFARYTGEDAIFFRKLISAFLRMRA